MIGCVLFLDALHDCYRPQTHTAAQLHSLFLNLASKIDQCDVGLGLKSHIGSGMMLIVLHAYLLFKFLWDRSYIHYWLERLVLWVTTPIRYCIISKLKKFSSTLFCIYNINLVIMSFVLFSDITLFFPKKILSGIIM